MYVHSVDFGVTLTEKGVNVNFSKIRYHDIAPTVGLESTLASYDMPTFEIHRARIPTSLFKLIVGDLEIVMNPYGEPRDHKNEKARSRFLAPVCSKVSFATSSLTLLPAFQSHDCSFQINYP